MTLKRVRIASPNYSSRGGAGVRLIVLHATEGALTYQALGNFFANPASGVSSHVGIDDTPNTVGEYVDRAAKAWTASGANPVAVQAELCAPSGASMGWSAAQWNAHPHMLANTAAWIAEEAAHFGLPIVGLTPAQAQGSGRGICQHADLGAWGGGHSDLGPHFPINSVISMAAGAPPPSPQPPPLTGEHMILTDPATNGVWVIASKEGAVNAYDGAPYLGGTNNTAANAGKYPCVGIDTWRDPAGQWGYVIVLDWGGQPGDRYRRYRFRRDGSDRITTGTY